MVRPHQLLALRDAHDKLPAPFTTSICKLVRCCVVRIPILPLEKALSLVQIQSSPIGDVAQFGRARYVGYPPFYQHLASTRAYI